VKAKVETGVVVPATGVTGVDFNSFGEQSVTPPDEGTKAMPSIVYAGARVLCVSGVPVAMKVPTYGAEAGIKML
jgi:hypothetical protein